MYLLNTEALDLWSAAQRQRRVIYALLLRNIRTRFFGHGLGYLFALGWPLSHILIVVALFSFSGRTAPYGDSTTLFVATGALPFMTFSYLARFMMLSVIRNRPLLAFPEVKVLDVLMAGAVQEILAASCVTLMLMVLAWLAGIEVVPRDIVQAALAYAAAILLGLGFGMLNGVLALALPMWFTGYALANIVLWVTSGVVFVPDAMPAAIRAVLAYHPVLQIIEWTRAAYYEGYGSVVLDRAYPVYFGIVTLFLGLFLERMVRGHLLALR